MSDVNVQLNAASVQVIDNTSNAYQVNTAIGSIVLPATASIYADYFQVGTSPISLTLPGATAFFVYIKNLSETATVSVTCTPQGGSVWASPLVLAFNSTVPDLGGVFLYCQPSEANGGGISAISLVASANNTPIEVLVAA